MLERVARTGRRSGWQGASEAHPPLAGCNERATWLAAPSSALRPEGCVAFGASRRCLLGRDHRGYRQCARALASAKIDSNAAHSSISTVS